MGCHSLLFAALILLHFSNTCFTQRDPLTNLNRAVIVEPKPVRWKLLRERDQGEDEYQLSSDFQTMRFWASATTMGTEKYVCPQKYSSYMGDWAYTFQKSWEWCGNYCESEEHNNYATEEKINLMQDTIILKAIQKILPNAPLIRREEESLVAGPFDKHHRCGRVRINEDYYTDGLSDTDVVVYFSISPFPKAERKSLVWGSSCSYSDGRPSAVVVNVNPCWILDNTEKVIEATADAIADALGISRCPKGTSILLHNEEVEGDNVAVCVQVKCNSDRTLQVKFKNGAWLNCDEKHQLGINRQTTLFCPPFDDVCEEKEEADSDEEDEMETRDVVEPFVDKVIPAAEESDLLTELLKRREALQARKNASKNIPPNSSDDSSTAIDIDAYRRMNGSGDSSVKKIFFTTFAFIVSAMFLVAVM